MAVKKFEVGHSYLAKSGISCGTDAIITVTKRTKQAIYFTYTTKKHGCNGVYQARVLHYKDANGSGEAVEIGGHDLLGGVLFCSWYNLIDRLHEEETFIFEELPLYNKAITREAALKKAVQLWSWCFAE